MVPFGLAVRRIVGDWLMAYARFLNGPWTCRLDGFTGTAVEWYGHVLLRHPEEVDKLREREATK
jgi:hypothetical protein